MTSSTNFAAAILLIATTATLPAQNPSPFVFEPAISATVRANNDLTLTTTQVGEKPVQHVIPAGTRLQPGTVFDVQSQPSAQALVWVQSQQTQTSFHTEVTAIASTAHGHAGAASELGRMEFLFEFTLDRAMTIEIDWGAWMISCANAPGGIAEIDFGNDGSPEFSLTLLPSSFAVDSDSLLFPMPAGTTPVLMSVELDLPAVNDPLGRVADVRTHLSITPAHAQPTWEGTPCQATLDARQLLDGETVRFWLAGQQIGDIPFLVLGLERAQTPLPFTPGCPLLVSPDVTLPMAFWSYEYVPLGALGPGEVFAQGVLLRPQAMFLSPAGVFTTQRIALELQ